MVYFVAEILILKEKYRNISKGSKYKKNQGYLRFNVKL